MSYLANPHRFAPSDYSEFYPVSNVSTNSSSFSMNFGDEDPSRYIIASVSCMNPGGNGSITGVTIGGVAATQLVTHGGTSTITSSNLWIAAVPTGTSGTVVLTVSGYNQFVVQLYRAVNLATTTPHGTDTITTISLTVPALGVALIAATTQSSTGVPATSSFTDSMLTAVSRARLGLSFTAMRSVHTWKVSPGGDALSSAHTLAGSVHVAGCSLRFSYPFAPPVAFEAGHWSVADAVTDGELIVTVSTIKSTGVTSIEYQLDGGSWVDAGHVPPGRRFIISGLTNDQEYDIAIRPVTVSGTGSSSDVKQATPTDGGVTVSYAGSLSGTENATGVSMGGVVYGGGHGHAERMIIVGLITSDDLGGTLNDPSGLTINGVSATKHVNMGAPGNRLTQIWSAIVPSDPNGDGEVIVAFTNSEFTTSQAIIVHKAYGITSITPNDTMISSASPTATNPIDCPAGGFIVGYFRGHNSNAVTWVGLATEDLDVAFDTSRRLSAAHEDFATTQTGRTVSATQTSGTANRLAVASWG